VSGGVTVVVPVWNRRDLLGRVLDGLRTQTCAAHAVLVVDDGSEDGSAELAESLGAQTIRMEAHGGFAKAVTRGIRESHTPLVAIVNNDVELAPDWVEKLSAALAPDVWFATGKVLQAGAPDRIDGTYDVLCRGGTAWRVGHGCRDGPAFREARQIWSAPMTAALFRSELFDRVGMPDERFESYLEDVDFGVRCALAGCTGQYVPAAVAWHQGSATMGRWHPETVRRISRNQVFLTAKHYSRRMLASYAWHILVAQGLWGLVALRHGCGQAWLKGKVEGIRRWRELRDAACERNRRPDSIFQGEETIRGVQRECGWDLYWILYFLLTTGEAK